LPTSIQLVKRGYMEIVLRRALRGRMHGRRAPRERFERDPCSRDFRPFFCIRGAGGLSLSPGTARNARAAFGKKTMPEALELLADLE